MGSSSWNTMLLALIGFNFATFIVQAMRYVKLGEPAGDKNLLMCYVSAVIVGILVSRLR